MRLRSEVDVKCHIAPSGQQWQVTTGRAADRGPWRERWVVSAYEVGQLYRRSFSGQWWDTREAAQAWATQQIDEVFDPVPAE